MDAQALLTADAVEHAMGMPLAHIPDQVADGHASYARHHAQVFIDLFADLGVRPDRYYWMSEVYAAGSIDPYVRVALDRAAEVRALYRRVANVNHPDTWHPLLVICETCGRVGTTIVTKWDGERVFYECRADLVTWARGCGSSGWVSPFGGRAKLPWNLEWAAQWSVWGVTIEPCGKDLATAGGSRDRADAIAREIFEREPPIRVDYEFLNVGGKKMSTSKGRGTAAHRIVEVLPPEPLRTLMIRSRPNHAIDFEPEGTDAVPRQFDEFDRLGDATAGRDVKGELPPGFASVFRYALRDPEADVEAEAVAFRAPFSHLAFLVQVAGADVVGQMTAEKGSALTEREAADLKERIAAARIWVADYAPERARYAVVRDRLPDLALEIEVDMRRFLGALANAAEADWPSTGAAWQNLIFQTAGTEQMATNRRSFAAIYAAFLGRENGPRAGWLLAGLEPEFVVARLREAAAGGVASGEQRT